MAASPITEAQVEAYLCAEVKALGGEVRKVGWIGRRGAPDRYVMLPGFTPNIWVELKRPGKKAEPHQEREHERMRAFDEIVHVVSTYAEVDAVLARAKRETRR